MPPIVIALGQMLVVPGAKDGNLRRAVSMIRYAAERRADVVVLPEALTLGWTHPSARREVERVPGGYSCSILQDAARSNRLYVVAGIVEADDGAIYNSALLIEPGGEILLHHRKINELSIAQDLYARGDRLGVAPTSFGTVGLMVCADAFAEGQVITRALGQMGAQMILSPCSWAVEPNWDNSVTPYGGEWREAYGPPARDFGMWIVGVSNVGWISDGPWRGWRCIGNSLVVGPDGRQKAQGPHGVDAEGVLFFSPREEAEPPSNVEWHEAPPLVSYQLRS